MLKFTSMNKELSLKISLLLLKLKLKAKKHKVAFPLVWLGSTTTAAIFTITLLLVTITNSHEPKQTKYSIYAARPYVLGEATSNIQYSNAEVATLEAVFKRYNCPIAGTGELFVKHAEKNNIPYWLVASIAFQESSCGKNTPTKEGRESNNLWGWGVYGDKVSTFKDIEEGIDTVSRYMADVFYSNGVTDLCEIMETYTPPSNGSWCEGVGFFRDQILEFESS